MNKAVVDRIVDGKTAVLLVGEKEIEQNVPIEKLPPGTKEGTWLQIHRDGSYTLDHQAESQVKNRIEQKKALLLQKKRDSMFKK